MGIENLYAAGIQREYDRKLTNPDPPPAQSFSAWSFAGAGLVGFPAAALEVSGSGLDFLGVADEQTRRRPRPGVLQDQPAIREGMDFSGDVMRRKAAEFAPDPQTAHVADQTIYGLTRFGSKAIAAIATAGPFVGPALLGAEETNTAYRGLLEKGVDPSTAMTVATVQGLVSAVGVALPISGAAVPGSMLAKGSATAGLVAVGGPGSYVLQEGLSREILQRTGYDKEAATHDPSDPLGLAISTILPGIFGGLALRGARVGNLAREKDAVAAAALSPAEQKASDAFERSAANIAELQKAIAGEKRPEAKAILQTELEKQTSLAQKHATDGAAERGAADPAVVDAARVKVTEDALTRSLPDRPNARAEVLRAEDDLAAGEMPNLPPLRDFELPEFRAWFGDSKVVDEAGAPLVVYHGTTGDFDRFMPGEGGGMWFSSSPEIANAHATRMIDGERGNVMPAYLSLKNPVVIDAAAGDKNVAGAISRAYRDGNDGVIVKNHSDLGQRGDVLVAFRPEQIKSAIGNSGRFDPNSASLTDPLQPGERSPRERTNTLPEQDAVTAATQKAAFTSETPEAPAAARVANLAKVDPTLRVKLPGSDETITIGEALDRAKAEAADEAADADLVRVAAECALSFGA